MGISYSIQIWLAADYKKTNISKILQAGAKKGFVYHDQIDGSLYEDAPVITPDQAANKIILAEETQAELGPYIFTGLENKKYASLYFFNKNASILFDIGVFVHPNKKDGFLDFGYYVKLFLDLCDDFLVIEVKTERDDLL